MLKDPLTKFNLPAESMGKTFSDWIGKPSVSSSVLRWVLKTIKCFTEKRRSFHLLLMGHSLSGKTFLVSLLLQEVYRLGFSVDYHRLPLFLDRIFSYYRGEDTELVKEILRPQFAVFEDMGDEPASGMPHVRKFVRLLLSDRGYGTILTTRKSLSQLQTDYGPELLAAVNNHCIVIHCPLIVSLVTNRETIKKSWLEDSE